MCAAPLTMSPSDATSTAAVPFRELGRTGVKVSAIGLGGWHLGLPHVDEPLSIRIVRSAIDRGITFMDNSWDYNEGTSEIRMGKALRDRYREKVFLMTKIDGRSKAEAARQLDESLRRLQTDHIDLVQHHEVIRFEDPNRIFDQEGANAALLDARRAGKLPVPPTGWLPSRVSQWRLPPPVADSDKAAPPLLPLKVLPVTHRPKPPSRWR